ncbi:MAG: C69 family dipeptidase [Planctomycetia bacterium]|nr:C69 family dipeptidase [Planctomycetia bacterium]
MFSYRELIQTLTITTLFIGLFFQSSSEACTSILVTKGASTNNSCMITYAADSSGYFAKLAIIEASDGSKRPKGGSPFIAEGEQTYKVFGFYADYHKYEFQGIMNEYQVAISETTFEGRPELQNKVGKLYYQDLMTIALQRSKTAREAIRVMNSAIEEFGYIDVGESISICDKNEAWVFEIIGTGSLTEKENNGAIWVARRVPDGQISAHANQARIGQFNQNDPENCLYSANIESFAIKQGFYDPNSGIPFSFADAYGAIDNGSKRYCEKRVWSIYRRVAPSQNFSDDYAQGVPNAPNYPWSIVPDEKLSVADVMALMRDHFDGTPYDMTKGIDAGEFGTPRRNRPLAWTFEGQKYAWERPISTQQTCFTMITQSRETLPDEIGALVWFGWDDSYSSCYFPLYVFADKLPPSCCIGSIDHFNMESAWWAFNFVANYAYPRYSQIIPDILSVQKELESQMLELQPVIEKTALELYSSNKPLMQTYLTDYSVAQAEKVHSRWKQLAHDLVVKFNDGFIRAADGTYPNIGYPDEWMKRVVEEKGEQFLIPEEPE